MVGSGWLSHGFMLASASSEQRTSFRLPPPVARRQGIFNLAFCITLCRWCFGLWHLHSQSAAGPLPCSVKVSVHSMVFFLQQFRSSCCLCAFPLGWIRLQTRTSAAGWSKWAASAQMCLSLIKEPLTSPSCMLVCEFLGQQHEYAPPILLRNF